MHFFVACFLLLNLITSHGAMASNRAIDMKIVEQDARMKVVLLLENAPRYSLRAVKGDQILLTLFDTKITSLMDRRISENRPIMAVNGEGQSSDFGFHIRLGRPFHEIGSSWLSRDKLLYIEIIPADGVPDKAADEKGASHKPSTFRNIRFGFKENATRIVLGLNHPPLWKMTYRDQNLITIQLDALSDTLKKKKFGPMKRLTEVVLKQNDKRLDLGIKLASELHHVRVFWVEAGARLVMDVLDEPAAINDASLILTTPAKNRQTGQIIQEEETKPDIEAEPTQPETIFDLETEPKTNSDLKVGPETVSDLEMGSIVRMKMPKMEGSDPEPKKNNEQPPHFDPAYDLIFELVSEDTSAEKPDGKTLTQKLSSDEALM